MSFSQVTTVEFCRRRYYLEYVALVEPDPIPQYFTKGKLLHQAIAASYEQAARQQPLDRDIPLSVVAQAEQEDMKTHLRNAVEVHLDNFWTCCDVLGVETPFVMELDQDLPPCVGVIDLVLQREGVFLLIDHKTGRDFYPLDELQMAIYVEYVRRQYGDAECQFFYDQYRWVNNLKRIRKPAFQRKQVSIAEGGWSEALNRIRKAYREIEKIRSTNAGEANGECFRCPFRAQCWS